MTLCCPVCRADLRVAPDAAACPACGLSFPAVGPVLDLRVPGVSWIDYEEDRARARRLLALGESVPAKLLLEAVFRSRPGWTDARIAHRMGQALTAIARLRHELDDWLKPCLEGRGPVLDLGCGAGQLTAALSASGAEAVGVDVSLEWLLVADRLGTESGRKPRLIAALAESLPFHDEVFSAVLSLDVIEHVGDQAGYVREINRVLAPGGHAALTTPNRFSAAAEPHVGVWGVGWLPRAWQKGYVAWRTRIPYEFVRLLSARELRGLFRRETTIEVTVRVAPIPAEDLAQMRGRRALLGRGYNALVALPVVRDILRAVAPFFRILGRKRRGGNTALAAETPA